MDYNAEEMDYEPQIVSHFLATVKETLSPEALSTLRVMAFLDPRYLQKGLFKHLKQLFATENEELMFYFPTTMAAHTKACTELVKASLIQWNEDDERFSMTSEIQTSVLADTQPTGLISPLFNAIVKLLTGLWPQMICVPDRTVEQEGFAAATAPGTDDEVYLKPRYSEGGMTQLQEYIQYARVNVWGGRDELVRHIARLEHIFYQLDDDMVEVCATITFAMILAEASWYYLERSRCHDAEVKIQAALGVYGLARGKSPLHHASIYRVHAAIALARGKSEEAVQHVNLQMEQLELRWTEQGQMLKESGLLDRAPDAVATSPWGLDVPPGKFVVLPFRSVCSFGWKIYLNAFNEKDPKIAQWLDQAQLCFSTLLRDRISADTGAGQMHPRTAELLYALGNVASKHASLLGEDHFEESLKYYEAALQHFQATDPDNRSSASTAKTLYKLGILYMRSQNYGRAAHHIDKAIDFYASNAAYSPHLARLLFQVSRLQTQVGDPRTKSTLHNAFAIRSRITSNGNRFAEELVEGDFDELVGIWER